MIIKDTNMQRDVIGTDELVLRGVVGLEKSLR